MEKTEVELEKVRNQEKISPELRGPPNTYTSKRSPLCMSVVVLAVVAIPKSNSFLEVPALPDQILEQSR